MSNLRKIRDEERESKFGYVYAVSGPGKCQSSLLGREELPIFWWILPIEVEIVVLVINVEQLCSFDGFLCEFSDFNMFKVIL